MIKDEAIPVVDEKKSNAAFTSGLIISSPIDLMTSLELERLSLMIFNILLLKLVTLIYLHKFIMSLNDFSHNIH